LRIRPPSHKWVPSKYLTNIEYLGLGAFSNVVRLVDTPGEFMKMPKSAALAKSLEQEAVILRELQSGDGVTCSIPRLVYHISLERNVDEEKQINPRLRTRKNTRLQWLQYVIRSVYSHVVWRNRILLGALNHHSIYFISNLSWEKMCRNSLNWRDNAR
jgi:hypothetical protein